MEKTAQAQPTKPTEPSSVGFEGTFRRNFLITHDLPGRGSRVLAAVNALVEPAGLSQWLWAERPDLITRGQDLVRQIDGAWFAPLLEFESALEQFVLYHAECCRQFEMHRPKPQNTILESDRTHFERPKSESVARCSGNVQRASWAHGYACPGCKGTWQTEADLANHVGQCPLVCKSEVRG